MSRREKDPFMLKLRRYIYIYLFTNKDKHINSLDIVTRFRLAGMTDVVDAINYLIISGAIKRINGPGDGWNGIHNYTVE